MENYTEKINCTTSNLNDDLSGNHDENHTATSTTTSDTSMDDIANQHDNPSDDSLLKNIKNSNIPDTPTPKDADFYNLQTNDTRLAFIISITDTTGAPSIASEQSTRLNSIIEAKFGFQVRPFLNLTFQEIKQHVKNELKRRPDISGLMCMIFTSSTAKGEIRLKNGTLELSELWEIFSAKNCTKLIGKPKMFFVITNQTLSSSPPVHSSHDNNNDDDEETESEFPCANNKTSEKGEIYSIPTYADFTTYYTTSDTVIGGKSVFIEAFCDQLEHKSMEKLKELDLSMIMTFIVQRYNYYLGKHEAKGVMNMSTLTRQIVFPSQNKN